MVARMAKIRNRAGSGVRYEQAPTPCAADVKGCPKAAARKIVGYFKDAGKRENGWAFFTKTGIYGTDYVDRAFITASGLGANRPQDAVYPTSEADADGKPYSRCQQVRHAFRQGSCLLQTVSGRSRCMTRATLRGESTQSLHAQRAQQALKKNADGSVDLYLQHENPGKDKESNWLPAPADKFVLMLRMYWPRETPPSLLDGTWTIPGAKLVR